MCIPGLCMWSDKQRFSKNKIPLGIKHPLNFVWSGVSGLEWGGMVLWISVSWNCSQAVHLVISIVGVQWFVFMNTCISCVVKLTFHVLLEVRHMLQILVGQGWPLVNPGCWVQKSTLCSTKTLSFKANTKLISDPMIPSLAGLNKHF